MKEVEEASKAAIESCHRVLSHLSRPKSEVVHGNLMMESKEAVFKFKKVVSLLNNSLGHARVRKLMKPPPPLPHRIFLDRTNDDSYQSTEQHPPVKKTLMLLESSGKQETTQIKELGSHDKNYLCLGSPAFSSHNSNSVHKSSVHYQLLQQQQQQYVMKQRLMMHQHQQQQQQQQQQLLLSQADKIFGKSNSNGISLSFDGSSCNHTVSSNTRSFISSLSVDGSVANIDGTAFHLIGAPRSSDHSLQQHKRKCPGKGEEGNVKCSSSSRCHCSKKRKHRIKRSIKVPAVSNKLADIPPDDYSWRKYGQKPIKGSPHPRGYYKCSSMRGCPARKHVERCLEEPTMLIVTYEGEHNHAKVPSQSTNA